ncbi:MULTISPECIES: RloB family protein [Gordonibacter]|uniref:RloB family protein n=1 Tax=Gordonibacter faecis TaxID=3047475 RepID=A0ABT7DMQ0_9ACTN|nr:MULTISPECIES: RloB family protein [unclassified Gordonibacter]MDJ1650815.1 RloB family protein [Gordonibacter sp. KGMB12511]HIW77155.1 RloB family protein [Candidatus Gordonibacter avicola]
MGRVILICCEGKTEKEYFEILRRSYRIPGYVGIHILGEKGQHKALIDRTLEERDILVQELGINADDIECWSVCDDDRMTCSYAELLNYAESHKVKLAFTRPQFEAFLVQHFEQTGIWKKEDLYSKLAAYRKEMGFDAVYDDSAKSDLRWMEKAIDEKPKRVDTAVVNANLRLKQSDRCFMTVQQLVERLRDLGI